MEIEILKPVERRRVIDLLESVGIDVTDWGNFKGGAGKAASNPKYCYEWSYEDRNKEIIVLNLWYSNLEASHTKIFQNLNMRETERHVKNPSQKRRAIKMDFSLQTAARLNCSVRVIICDGSPQENDATKSIAERRLLDTEPWHIQSYSSDTGACVLVRGGHNELFIDQFSIENLLEGRAVRNETISFSYERSPKVRTDALNRANGNCEWCGAIGFKTSAGSIYLESHHIQPLSEDGADNIYNVIALCPNHHREAHFGESSEQFKKLLFERIEKLNKSLKHQSLRSLDSF